MTSQTSARTYDPFNIIMVSYMRPNDLMGSINSIVTNTDLPYRLTIIDNSCGAVDFVLDKFYHHPNIHIIFNPSNYGKAKSFNMYLDTILIGDTNHSFVSIDGDIEVPKGWLSKLLDDRDKLTDQFGLLAPYYVDNFNELPKLDGTLKVHQKMNFRHFVDNIYYNKRLGGGLLLINKAFYNSVGGYDGDILYGGDDGKLCRAASERNLFIGLTTSVSVRHLRNDETIDYRLWKKSAINNKKITSGYWDLNNCDDNKS